MNNRPERFKLIPAVYLVLRHDDQVLLLRRANTGYQDGKYSLVAGHLDGDELATACLAREAREEAGITVRPESLRLVHTVHRLTRSEPGQERIDLYFEATEWEGDITNAEPHKCDDLSWHPITALPDAMIPMVRNTLERIAQGVPYSEYTTEPV